MAVYTETIQLKDQVSGPAKAAQGAVTSLATQLQQTQNLAQNAAPGGGSGGGIASMFANADHAAQVGQASIGAAISSIKGAFTSLANGDAKGAVEGLFDAVSNLSKMLDLVVPGLGQVVSTIVSIAGGIAGVTAGLVQSGAAFAISATQDKEAMLAMFDAMGDGVSTGADLDDMLSDLSDQFGVSKDQLTDYTTAFLRMGVTSEDQLRALTTAATSAFAIAGSAGESAFEGLQKKLQTAAETSGTIKLNAKLLQSVTQAGGSLDDLATALGTTKEKLSGASVDAKKFGDALTDSVTKRGETALDRLGNTTASIKGKFMSNVGDLFEDMAPSVDAFMKQVRSLFDIFGQSEPSGQALKTGIQAFFSETLDLAAKLVPMVKHFLLEVIIYALEAYLALRPTVTALQDWLKTADGLAAQQALWDTLKLVLVGIAVIVGLVVGAFSLLVGVSIAVGAALALMVGEFVNIAEVVGGAFIGALEQAETIGTQFVQGLINGITNGTGMVTDSVKNLANNAVTSLENALGIASPSKVGMDIGYNLGSSVGMGATAANDVVADASSGVAGTASSAMQQGAQASQPSGASSAGGAQNVFYITIEGAGKSAEEISDDMIAASWERMALAAGT